MKVRCKMNWILLLAFTSINCLGREDAKRPYYLRADLDNGKSIIPIMKMREKFTTMIRSNAISNLENTDGWPGYAHTRRLQPVISLLAQQTNFLDVGAALRGARDLIRKLAADVKTQVGRCVRGKSACDHVADDDLETLDRVDAEHMKPSEENMDDLKPDEKQYLDRKELAHLFGVMLPRPEDIPKYMKKAEKAEEEMFASRRKTYGRMPPKEKIKFAAEMKARGTPLSPEKERKMRRHLLWPTRDLIFGPKEEPKKPPSNGVGPKLTKEQAVDTLRAHLETERVVMDPTIIPGVVPRMRIITNMDKRKMDAANIKVAAAKPKVDAAQARELLANRAEEVTSGEIDEDALKKLMSEPAGSDPTIPEDTKIDVKEMPYQAKTDQKMSSEKAKDKTLLDPAMAERSVAEAKPNAGAKLTSDADDIDAAASSSETAKVAEDLRKQVPVSTGPEEEIPEAAKKAAKVEEMFASRRKMYGRMPPEEEARGSPQSAEQKTQRLMFAQQEIPTRPQHTTKTPEQWHTRRLMFARQAVPKQPPASGVGDVTKTSEHSIAATNGDGAGNADKSAGDVQLLVNREQAEFAPSVTITTAEDPIPDSQAITKAFETANARSSLAAPQAEATVSAATEAEESAAQSTTTKVNKERVKSSVRGNIASSARMRKNAEKAAAPDSARRANKPNRDSSRSTRTTPTTGVKSKPKTIIPVQKPKTTAKTTTKTSAKPAAGKDSTAKAAANKLNKAPARTKTTIRVQKPKTTTKTSVKLAAGKDSTAKAAANKLNKAPTQTKTIIRVDKPKTTTKTATKTTAKTTTKPATGKDTTAKATANELTKAPTQTDKQLPEQRGGIALPESTTPIIEHRETTPDWDYEAPIDPLPERMIPPFKDEGPEPEWIQNLPDPPLPPSEEELARAAKVPPKWAVPPEVLEKLKRHRLARSEELAEDEAERELDAEIAKNRAEWDVGVSVDEAIAEARDAIDADVRAADEYDREAAADTRVAVRDASEAARVAEHIAATVAKESIRRTEKSAEKIKRQALEEAKRSIAAMERRATSQGQKALDEARSSVTTANADATTTRGDAPKVDSISVKHYSDSHSYAKQRTDGEAAGNMYSASDDAQQTSGARSDRRRERSERKREEVSSLQKSYGEMVNDDLPRVRSTNRPPDGKLPPRPTGKPDPDN